MSKKRKLKKKILKQEGEIARLKATLSTRTADLWTLIEGNSTDVLMVKARYEFDRHLRLEMEKQALAGGGDKLTTRGIWSHIEDISLRKH